VPTSAAKTAAATAGGSTAAPAAGSAGAKAGDRSSSTTGARLPSGGTSPPPARGGFMSGLIGGVLGGGAAALALWFFLLKPDADSSIATIRSEVGGFEQRLASTEAVADQLKALEQRTEALNAEIQSALGEVAAAGDSPIDPALGEQLAALQQRLDQLSGEVAAANALEGNVQDRIQSVEGNVQDTIRDLGSDLGGQIGELQTGMAALSERVDQAESRIEVVGDAYRQATAMVVAIDAIDRAVAASEPFQDSLDVLSGLGGDDPVVAASLPGLTPVAASGGASESRLRAGLEDLGNRIAGAELAGDEGMIGQAAGNLLSLVKVRPVGEAIEGDEAGAVIARAEARLEEDDLAGAITEVESLEGDDAAAAADWLAMARERQEAEQAIAALKAHMQTLLSNGS
jgi:hypothetical protein